MINCPEIILCLGITLLCGLAVPCCRRRQVPGNAATILIHDAKVALRRGNALIRCFAVQEHCLCLILGYALTARVHESQSALGAGEILRYRLLKP